MLVSWLLITCTALYYTGLWAYILISQREVIILILKNMYDALLEFSTKIYFHVVLEM